MRDGTRSFFQIQGIFHYFRAFKTKILPIYSLTGQILKQLSPSVSVTSVRNPPLVTSTSGDNCQLVYLNLIYFTAFLERNFSGFNLEKKNE